MSVTTTLILGAGFGGIAAANTLRRLVPAEHDIVVVDRAADFHVGAGKTWVMLGERTVGQISQARAKLLEPGVRFVQAEVTKLDLEAKRVVTAAGTLAWNHLVIALGVDLDLASVPGVKAAETFYTLQGAERLRGKLEAFTGGDLAIVIPRLPFKCPPAPYEAACLLHHSFQARGLGDRVRIALYTVEGAPMGTAGPEMGQYIRGELAQRNIAYHPQKKLAAVDGEARRIRFEDGSDAGYDLLMVVPPHVAPQVVRDAQLAGPSGWVPADPQTLRVQGAQGEVYAVGDVTAVPLPGRYKPDLPLSLPKAGVFAEAHGRTVAHQIAAKILGRPAEQSFDGHGYCYLELGGGRAVKAEGSFFEQPHPVMQKREPDEAQFQDKLSWVERHLAPVR